METGSTLHAFLTSNPAIAAVVGSRVYPVQLPQKPTLPAVRYNTISGLRTQSQPGVQGLRRPRVQIDCYAETYAAAVNLRELVAARLNSYRGPAGVGTMQGAFLVNEYERFDDQSKAFIVSADYYLWLP